MSPTLILAIVLGWVASLGGASYVAFGLGQDNITAFNAKADKIVEATREAAQQGAAQAIAANQPVNKTIVQKVQHEIETNTVYADCRHTALGLSGINEALTGRPQPAGDSKLP